MNVLQYHSGQRLDVSHLLRAVIFYKLKMLPELNKVF